MKRSGWIVVGLLAIAPVCSAQVQELGPEITVHAPPNRASVRPRVAMDTSGQTVVVWPSFDNYGRGRIYARRLVDGKRGTRLYRPFMIGVRSGADQMDAAIDSDPVTGRFVVAWRDRVVDPSRVLAQMFLPSGVPSSRVLVVDNLKHPFQIQPAVAMASDGGFFILWNGYADEPGHEFKMYGRRYNAKAAPRGPAFVVEEEPAGQFANMCRTRSGGFVATTNGHQGVVHRFDAAGRPVGDEIVVPETSDLRPMCRFEDDGFVLGWSGFENGVSVPYVQAYGADGVPIANAQPIAADTDFDHQSFQSAAPLAGGGFLATWFAVRRDGGNGEVFGRWMTATGEPASDPFQINATEDAMQAAIAVASAPGRPLFAVWQSGTSDWTWAILGRTISPPAP